MELEILVNKLINIWGTMKHSIIIFVCLALSSISLAEQKFNPATTPINTFKFIGNALVCISDKLTNINHACYRFGNLKIGDTYNPKEKPWKEIPRKNGVTASVFPIIANEKNEAYWIFGHKNKKIVSIQLTGNYVHEKLSFSTIMLGDKKEKVRKILGPNYTVTKVDAIKGVMWDYYPFAISVEFIKNKVYSIRIAEERSNK